MRAAPAVVALLALAAAIAAGCTEPPAPRVESMTLPVLLVEHSFAPAEGELPAPDWLVHCAPVGPVDHEGAKWYMQLPLDHPAPAGGLHQRFKFSGLTVSTAETFHAEAYTGPSERPLRAAFGDASFGLLRFDGTGFLLDGQPLDGPAERSRTYDVQGLDGGTVQVTETARLVPAAQRPVDVHRAASFPCI